MRKYIQIAACAIIIASVGCDGQHGLVLPPGVFEGNANPTEQEAAAGLKQALNMGVDRAVSGLSASGGFSKSDIYRILLPPEAVKMENTLRDLGFGSEVDRAVSALNEGAEKAVGEATEIFVGAIRQMTIQDALGIVSGGDGAATEYLQRTTSAALKGRFQPQIQTALDQVGALRYWGDITSTYNKIPFVQKVETDLNGYVTDRAMVAMFDQIRQEELKIRQDPAARATDLLRKVFGYADRQQ